MIAPSRCERFNAFAMQEKETVTHTALFQFNIYVFIYPIFFLCVSFRLVRVSERSFWYILCVGIMMRDSVTTLAHRYLCHSLIDNFSYPFYLEVCRIMHWCSGHGMIYVFISYHINEMKRFSRTYMEFFVVVCVLYRSTAQSDDEFCINRRRIMTSEHCN